MRLDVWVDQWQYDCCGDPFAVGDTVSWTLRPSDVDWLSAVLGYHRPDPLPVSEERHGSLPDHTPETTGVVRALAAVYCRFALRPGSDADDPHALQPVRGTEWVQPLASTREKVRRPRTGPTAATWWSWT